MANKDLTPQSNDVFDDLPDIDSMVEEFRTSKKTEETIVEPMASGTAEALTAAPVAKADPMEELKQMKAEADAARTAAATKKAASLEENTPTEEVAVVPAKRNKFMAFVGAMVPHVGDSAFDVVRKCIMVLGILVFVGAATYLVDDLVLIPQSNAVLVESLQSQYSPDAAPTLNEDELNFPYPAGMDDAFKKLYYQNQDIRGWITYKSTDGEMIDIDLPILQSEDNDYYLFHDFNKTYNKNGTLFFDFRNDITSPSSSNRNTIIYGHNMASGQMFAGLNNLLDGVDYARLAPTFTMDTLYKQGEYKVFAVMVVNNDVNDGLPFGYLQTEFDDNVQFATFLSEIIARSLYVYGDVDMRPDDEIVVLSTCTQYADVHFNDGRTVVVGRKVREGENPTTDVTKITTNADVLMPYGWYVNQKLEPHPYYIDANYVIQPLDTLESYLQTSTAGSGTTTTFPYYSQNGTYGLISSVTGDATTTLPTISSVSLPGTTLPTTPPTAAIYMKSFTVDSTPVYYNVGDSFNYDKTYITGTYSDGTRVSISPRHCAVEGFDTSRPGVCHVVIHYGSMHASFSITVRPLSTTRLTTTRTTTTVPPTTTTMPPTEVTTTTTEALIPAPTEAQEIPLS